MPAALHSAPPLQVCALIDTPPLALGAYQLDGTPSTVLIDAAERLRMKRLGHMSGLEPGAALGHLLDEASGLSERVH